MRYPFNARQGLIIVRARVWGPLGQRVVRLALDTGATSTLIRPGILVSIGYDPALALDRRQMTSASGVEYVPCLRVDKLEALGQQRSQFDMICHTLPPTATVDGLLGLDFLRAQGLTVDFRAGTIALG